MKYFNLCIILILLFTFSCKKPEYKLVVTLDPREAGIVNPISGEYKEGSKVDITVTPNEGYQFIGWGGDYEGTENPLSKVMEDLEIGSNTNYNMLNVPLVAPFRIQ